MTMNRLFPMLLVAAMCTAASLAHAADRYVRPGAAGANTGTDWANAFTSLPATLVRGDRYFLAEGTYPGRTFSTPVSGTLPITLVKATPGNHGTSVGWSDSYGDDTANFSSALNFTSSNWVIDGQTGGGAINKWGGVFGFKITETGDSNAVIKIGHNSTANNVTIRHVLLQGKGSVSNSGGSISNDGMAIYGASNVTLSYYKMQGIGRCPFFISPSDAIFEHGWVQSYYGSSSVHSEIASIWSFASTVGDVTFRHNLFTDVQSTGGIMWDNSANTGAHLYVYGNVFYKPAGASWQRANGVIGGWTGGGGEQFRNAAVYNNSFINVDQESLSTFPNIYSGNYAYNNLFYNSTSPSYAKYAGHDYNHYINSGGTHSEASGTSTTNGDPFVDYVNLDFRLKAGTSSGMTLQAPFNLDGHGKVRGADGNVDRGALEFGGGTLSPPVGLRVN
jgi:hypothetical protein